MKYTPFESYGNQTEIINEEIDAGIQSILNHDNINSKFKHNMMTQVVRSLIKQGKDTGLEDSKTRSRSLVVLVSSIFRETNIRWSLMAMKHPCRLH